MEDVVLITPPAMEPLTLDEFKDHCHITSDDEDGYISDIVIPGIRSAVESELKRVLVTQTWRYKMDGFPGFDPRYESHGYPTIVLPKPPFQSIESFTYVDPAGVLQELAECNPDGTAPAGQFYGYQVDPGSETQPARLLPPWAGPWPPSRRMPTAVQIEFVCGYGALEGSPLAWAPGPIPAQIKLAMLHWGASSYDNRWGVMNENLKEVPRGIATLLSPYINHIA